MVVEEHIHSIGATVALSMEGGGRIAFQRDPRQPSFVDYQGDIVAKWDGKGVTLSSDTIQGTDFSSNQWHNLPEGSDIKNYFKAVIKQHLEPITVYNEQAGVWQYRSRM